MAKDEDKSTAQKKIGKGRSSGAKSNPHGLTVKQMRFAQEYVSNGGHSSQAYRDSHACENRKPRSIASSAHNLLKQTNVSAYIAELQSELKQKYNYDCEQLLAKLENAYQVAQEVQQPTAMVSAVAGMARLLGLDRPKVEDDGGLKIQVVNFAQLPIDQTDEPKKLTSPTEEENQFTPITVEIEEKEVQ